jgi:hypothetical protein
VRSGHQRRGMPLGNMVWTRLFLSICRSFMKISPG